MSNDRYTLYTQVLGQVMNSFTDKMRCTFEIRNTPSARGPKENADVENENAYSSSLPGFKLREHNGIEPECESRASIQKRKTMFTLTFATIRQYLLTPY